MEAARLLRRIKYERDGGVAMMALGTVVALTWIALDGLSAFSGAMGLVLVLVGRRVFASAGILGALADRIVGEGDPIEPRTQGDR